MSKFSGYKNNKDLTNFQKNLISKYFINSKNIIYNNILSDEGGRFYHSQIKYMACIMDKNQDIKLPERYIWLSQNQFYRLLIDFLLIDLMPFIMLFGTVFCLLSLSATHNATASSTPPPTRQPRRKPGSGWRDGWARRSRRWRCCGRPSSSTRSASTSAFYQVAWPAKKGCLSSVGSEVMHVFLMMEL